MVCQIIDSIMDIFHQVLKVQKIGKLLIFFSEYNVCKIVCNCLERTVMVLQGKSEIFASWQKAFAALLDISMFAMWFWNIYEIQFLFNMVELAYKRNNLTKKEITEHYSYQSWLYWYWNLLAFSYFNESKWTQDTKSSILARY